MAIGLKPVRGLGCVRKYPETSLWRLVIWLDRLEFRRLPWIDVCPEFVEGKRRALCLCCQEKEGQKWKYVSHGGGMDAGDLQDGITGTCDGVRQVCSCPLL